MDYVSFPPLYNFRSLRVLLISPVSGLDPKTGDVTYTEQLLSCPPDSVEYVTYDVALQAGQVRELYRRHGRSLATIIRQGDHLRFAREAIINKVRTFGLLFRDSFRHFELVDPDIDLVHSHVFSVRLVGYERPLVVSNAVPLHALYTDAWHKNPRVTMIQARFDAALAASTGVTHSAYQQKGADVVICFSEYLQAWYRERSADPERFVVVPPAVELPDLVTTPMADCFRLGFIGDWQAKGGETVLQAVRMLRRDGFDVRLTVVGSEPRTKDSEAENLEIRWLPRIPRRRLLEEVIPSFSAFAYPSEFDGLPLTLLEVMAAGIPVIVSDYGALPEVVDHGKAGVVVSRRHPDQLARAIQGLVDPERRTELGVAARRRVAARFTPETTSRDLGAAYGRAVARWHRRYSQQLHLAESVPAGS